MKYLILFLFLFTSFSFNLEVKASNNLKGYSNYLIGYDPNITMYGIKTQIPCPNRSQVQITERTNPDASHTCKGINCGKENTVQ